MTITRIAVGDIELVRVGYADVLVPAERVGLTRAQVDAATWAEPTWAEAGQVRAGAAAWLIRTGDAVIVVDPARAADDILRSANDAAAHQDAFAALLESADVLRGSVTHAIATHVEGIGMFAWRNDDGSWSPFFPNAAIFVDERELAAIDSGTHPSPSTEAFDQLRACGAVRAVSGDPFTVAPSVTMEWAGGHTPGHAIVRVTSRGDTAVMVGHLAISPIHFVSGECRQQHPDTARVESVLRALCEEAPLLVGPLWPTPGAGSWAGDRIVPVDA